MEMTTRGELDFTLLDFVFPIETRLFNRTVLAREARKQNAVSNRVRYVAITRPPQSDADHFREERKKLKQRFSR